MSPIRVSETFQAGFRTSKGIIPLYTGGIVPSAALGTRNDTHPILQCANSSGLRHDKSSNIHLVLFPVDGIE